MSGNPGSPPGPASRTAVATWELTTPATDACGRRPINRVGLPMIHPLFARLDEDLGNRLNGGPPAEDRQNFGKTITDLVAGWFCRERHGGGLVRLRSDGRVEHPAQLAAVHDRHAGRVRFGRLERSLADRQRARTCCSPSPATRWSPWASGRGRSLPSPPATGPTGRRCPERRPGLRNDIEGKHGEGWQAGVHRTGPGRVDRGQTAVRGKGRRSSSNFRCGPTDHRPLCDPCGIRSERPPQLCTAGADARHVRPTVDSLRQAGVRLPGDVNPSRSSKPQAMKLVWARINPRLVTAGGSQRGFGRMSSPPRSMPAVRRDQRTSIVPPPRPQHCRHSQRERAARRARPASPDPAFRERVQHSWLQRLRNRNEEERRNA